MWLCSSKTLFIETEILMSHHFHVSKNTLLNLKRAFKNVEAIFSWRAIQKTGGPGGPIYNPCSKSQINPRSGPKWFVLGAAWDEQVTSWESPLWRLWEADPPCTRTRRTYPKPTAKREGLGLGAPMSWEKACNCWREKVEQRPGAGFSYPALKLKSNLAGNGCTEIKCACEALVVQPCALPW